MFPAIFFVSSPIVTSLFAPVLIVFMLSAIIDISDLSGLKIIFCPCFPTSAIDPVLKPCGDLLL